MKTKNTLLILIWNTLKTKSKIESGIEFVVSGIDSGEDTETLEETLRENKEMQEKLDNSVQELLDISPSEDADTLCSHFSKLKFKIRKTTTALANTRKKLKVQNKAMFTQAI